MSNRDELIESAKLHALEAMGSTAYADDPVVKMAAKLMADFAIQHCKEVVDSR